MSENITEVTLSDRIQNAFDEASGKGEYLTVRAAARVLGVKQTEVRDALPAGIKLDPASNGSLSDSRLALASSVEESEAPAEGADFQDVDGQEAGDSTISDAATVETVEEGVETVICAVCGNRVRKSTIVRRGICPLCFRQLAKNAGVNSTKLEAMSDEEFEAVLGKELGNRRSLEEYKASRILTKEQFDAFDPKLIPVKEVFAAAKEAGYGPGRVAQAMGGDRFRHEPLGGFGSVWTPYFYGARNGWHFDPEILNHFDDLKKPEKPVVEKKSRTAKDPTASRTGARGSKMTAVPVGTAVPVEEGTPADPDTAAMASTPA